MTTNDVLIIHVRPEPDAAGRVLLPNCKPISDEREADVWDKLRSLTTNPAVRRNIHVLTRSKQAQAEVMENFRLDDCNEDRIRFAAPVEIERTRWCARTKSRKTIKEAIPLTLSNATDAKVVADLCLRSNEVSALLVWHPEEYPADWQGWDGDLKHLPYLKERNVRTPIYIFHNDVHPDKWGVEIDGDENRAYRKNGNWQDRFHSQTEAMTLPEEMEIVVRGICNAGNASLWCALPKHGKSYLFLSIMKALLSGKPWLDYFDVSMATRVVYLVPEVGLQGITKRLRKMKMMEYLYDAKTNPEGGLYLQTLSSPEKLELDEPALLEAVKGADVFIDPIIRYIEGDENKSSDQKVLSDKLLNLIRASARTVWCSHHSAKAFKDVSEITSQNVARGSGEFAAFPDTIFGVLKTDDVTSRLYIKCTDARDDDEHLGAFEVEMRPWIDDTGDMKLVVMPGQGVPLSEQRSTKGGHPIDRDRRQKLDFIRNMTDSTWKKKLDAVNEHFPVKITERTLRRWVREDEASIEFEGGSNG